MNSVKKAKATKFWVALIVSILFVVGIPMIILGAVKSYMIVMVVGIVFVVFGFYGAPMFWGSYSTVKSLCRVHDAIVEEGLRTNKEIATHLQRNEREIKSAVTTLISKKYLTGFLYDGETLTENTKNKEEKKTAPKTNKCPNCGGKMENRENAFYCPYCDSEFEK